jgi:predicted phosphodiesterase
MDKTTEENHITFVSEKALAERDRSGEPARTRALVEALSALPPVLSPPWRELAISWWHEIGVQSEGLHADVSQRPTSGEWVTLPHLRFPPDMPFWYTGRVTLTELTVARIVADDGCQVFLDGQRVACQTNRFTLAPEVYGDHELILRVLNNAYSGGLEKVELAPLEEVERYDREAALRARLEKLVRKVRLLREPEPEEIEAALQAVRTPEEAAIAEAERALGHLPYIEVGPYLLHPAADAMTIVFETDGATEAYVEWGEGETPQRRLPTQAEDTLHAVTLTNLQPATTYAYRIVVGQTILPTYRFQTLPTHGSFAFTTWGDPHLPYGRETFRENLRAMAARQAAFMIDLGDSVNDGANPHAWTEFFRCLHPYAASTPLVLLAGNHDYDGYYDDLKPRLYTKYARNPDPTGCRAWVCGNAFFLALDPNNTFPIGFPKEGAQYRRIQEHLNSEACRQSKWRFLLIHQPPYSQSWFGYYGEEFLRDFVNEIAGSVGLDFVVSGHTHAYERWIENREGSPCHYLILGGAGGGLEDGRLNTVPQMDVIALRHHFGWFQVEAERVVFEAVATDTTVLDRLEVRKS